MQSTTIRHATVQDADRLTRLIRSCAAHRGPYASIVSGYRVSADYIARHRVFVAINETELLQGFYALLLEPPELDLAFVADGAQGRGVGRLLIEHM
ncbi:hypothetical protein AB0465_00155 [Streptomyces griseoviridis]|uniref:hypothetical protein n=1 Tax=Streptomyces griseoviridis TaxID=45398 RepID=UPI0034500BE7